MRIYDHVGLNKLLNFFYPNESSAMFCTRLDCKMFTAR